MRALVITYAKVRGIVIRDLFRSAYLSSFGKDITSGSLDQDVAEFTDGAPTPPYVTRYFLKIIGVKHENIPAADDYINDDTDPVQALRRAGL